MFLEVNQIISYKYFERRFILLIVIKFLEKKFIKLFVRQPIIVYHHFPYIWHVFQSTCHGI